jgi:hypothetical protein
MSRMFDTRCLQLQIQSVKGDSVTVAFYNSQCAFIKLIISQADSLDQRSREDISFEVVQSMPYRHMIAHAHVHLINDLSSTIFIS